MADKLRKLDWIQVAFFAIAVAGLVALAFAPQDGAVRVIALISTLAGNVVAVLRGPMFGGGGKGGASLLPIALALGCAATISACAPSSIEMSARVATALDELSVQSARVVRDERMAAMERVALEVRDRGGSEAEALEAARVEGAAWIDAVDIHASYDRAVRVFARGALAAVGGVSTLEIAIPTLLDAAAIYGRLVAFAERRGSTALPPIPAMVLQWIESIAPRDAAEEGATP